MCYFRCFGRPDLFITFPCNPNWQDITGKLYPGESPSDRHYIAAGVFGPKFKSLIDFIVKHKVFGKVRFCMYFIGWQKRGLLHILIWLVDKITTHQIDDLIS